MMSSRTRGRILCVNCRICVNSLRRFVVFELNTRVISLLSEWLSPLLVTDDDVICEACYDIAMRTVNQILASAHGGHSVSTSRQIGHTLVCILCGCSLANRQSHHILNANPSPLDGVIRTIIESRIEPRQIMSSNQICHPCWMSTRRSAVRQQQIDESRSQDELIETPQSESEPVNISVEDQNDEETTNVITLQNYRRASNTASHCLFPRCTNDSLHNMTDSLRATILSLHNYYIPKHARICEEHLHTNIWETLYNSDRSIRTFTMEQVEHIFSFVNAFKPFFNFDSIENIQEMEDNLFFYWTGRSKEDFITLVNEVPRLQEVHRGILGLASLIIKLRTGESDERLSTLLNVPRRTLERLMNNVREIILQDFVTNNLGINNVDRQSLLSHNLLIPNGLYNENNSNAIIICDGTYIYLNKSSNYKFQKDSYSLHKYKNLLKPFLLVTCDGYILDCFGPYKATTSDADIMIDLFCNENSPLRLYFQENDVFILDRGFRDSIPLLQSCNYRPYMPDSLLEGEHQLTTQQANRSRCITLCRWVVEVVNGHIKRDFKLLRQEYFNKSLPNMMQMFQRAASLLNRFGVRLKNRDDAGEILQVIRQRLHLENNLCVMITNNNMNRRTSGFRSITANRDDTPFPRMEYRQLILFALGTYQIRQARSYYGEHIRFHGNYIIEVSTENGDFSEFNLRGSADTTLIRGRIKSRHISRKIYFVYILIENNVPGREGIPEYYCNCLVGRRTIGCCAHVMTLVWYLGWARHQTDISAPAQFLDDVAVSLSDHDT